MNRTARMAAIACVLVLATAGCGSSGDGGEPGVGFVDVAGRDGGGPGDTAGGDTARRDTAGSDTARRDTRPDTGPPPTCPADGVACDDGDPCTIDDRCEGGACVGDRRSCDDGDPCTDDGCDPGAGGCFSVPGTGGVCDDGDPCTDDDRCQAGACVGTPDAACVCATDADCAAFEDGDPCNGTLVCVGGGCRVDPDTVVTCPPHGETCRRLVCEAGDCVPADEPDGTPCDDGTICFVQTTCQAGACVGAPLDCDDGVPCTRDTCSDLTGCNHIPLVEPCDDGNVCTDDACDPELGCVHADNEGPCDDGDPATTDDRCTRGVCRGTPGDCDDDNPCTVDSVDPGDGHCVHDAPAANGTPCDDGDPATTDDVCEDGLCVGRVERPSCDELDCDDDDPCTDDDCVDGRCVHVANEAPCDDGIFCTTDDRCEDGFCVGDASGCGACTTAVGASVSKVTELAIGEDGREGNALDVDGDPATCAPAGACDGGRDNALALLAGVANPLLESEIAEGSVVVLLAVPSWPPPEGSFDIEVFLAATPTDPGCDPLGAGCTWVVDPSQLDAACAAESRVRDVTYRARRFSGGGPGSRIRLTVPNPLGGFLDIPVQNVRLEADVQVVSQDDIRLTGIIAGAVPRDDPAIQTIAPPTLQPDLDLDGDGAAESVSIGLRFRGLPAAIAPRVCVPGYCFATGEAPCDAVIDCVQACDEGDDPCRVACFETGTYVAQERYLALGTCVQTFCPASDQTCIESNCLDELLACFSEDS